MEPRAGHGPAPSRRRHGDRGARARDLDILADCDEDERDEDAWARLDAQPDPAEAARQLLTAGASMEPRLRWITADAVGLLQEEALPVWREMAAVPGMGPHATFALFTMEAGPEPDEGEWLWLAVESAAVALADNQREPVPATEGLARALEAADLADRPDTGHRESRRAAPRDQALYGWGGDHLHAFRVRRVTYSDPSFSLEETRDEYAMRVLTALNAGSGKITYEYDFGAGWIHEIALQEKRAARARRRLSVLRQVQRRLTGGIPGL